MLKDWSILDKSIYICEIEYSIAIFWSIDTEFSWYSTGLVNISMYWKIMNNSFGIPRQVVLEVKMPFSLVCLKINCK